MKNDERLFSEKQQTVSMKNTAKTLLRTIALLFYFASYFTLLYGQDAQFSQFYATPTYLNPAFVGVSQEARATVAYRNQWQSLPLNFQTTAALYEHYLANYRLGIGGFFKNDRQSPTSTFPIASNEVALQLSYWLPINKKLTISYGIQGGYTTRNFNFSNLLFSQQFNSLTNNFDRSASSGENFGGQTQGFWDISSGVLAYTSRFWLGLSAHHLNRPNQSVLVQKDALPIRYSLQTGYKIPVGKQGKWGEDLPEKSIIPVLMYISQGTSNQMSAGIYAIFEPIMLGFWYRGLPIKQNRETYINHDALAFMVGVNTGRFTVGYSYDYTLSDLIRQGADSHEITLSYSFEVNHEHSSLKQKKYSRPRRCPSPSMRKHRTY
jgi:type IX secretion system PorP/SprF family membrane protein